MWATSFADRGPFWYTARLAGLLGVVGIKPQIADAKLELAAGEVRLAGELCCHENHKILLLCVIADGTG